MDTANRYTALLEAAYEIEGLLMLLATRSDTDTARLRALLAAKAGQLARDLADAAADCQADTEQHPDAKAAAENDAKAAADNDAKAIADSALGEEALMASVQLDPEPAPETEPTLDPEPKPAHSAPTVATIGEAEPPLSINDGAKPGLTLDEKLARKRAADFGRAFTLNDKFRFRRELFRDSQQELDEALGVISQMSTIGEAREYICDDLCLDPADPTVKEFIEILGRHF